MKDKQLPNEVLTHVPQMSLRDWEAGQVGPRLMIALLENNTFSEALKKVGEHAYQYADAMLKARVK